jgi:hypothetical protein
MCESTCHWILFAQIYHCKAISRKPPLAMFDSSCVAWKIKHSLYNTQRATTWFGMQPFRLACCRSVLVVKDGVDR